MLNLLSVITLVGVAIVVILFGVWFFNRFIKRK